MLNARLSLPSVLALVTVVGAGAFAAGRSTSSAGAATITSSPGPATPPAMPIAPDTEELPPGHPPTSGAGLGGGPNHTTGGGPNGALPPSHPPVGAGSGTPGADLAGDPDGPAPSSLDWKAPARWVVAPNTSTMRLATYRVPRATGDSDDAELSIMQAGGTVEANATRWVGQFDAEGQKTAKRTTRKVGALEITVVEVQGTFTGGMGKEPTSGAGFALLGAIVATPGMPHFFKLTGPAKTVLAARAEFDALVASLTPR
jgi:hypothetical protein